MLKLKNKYHIKGRVLYSIFAFLVTFGIMLLLFKLLGYAPFGENHLASMDADIQYLDFFSYYKDVLMGKNHIGYTFGKTLGGNNLAVFSYYLASPFNILVLFFEKANLQTFFDLLIALKIATAAVTFFCFLKGRFQNAIVEGLAVLLSISYALCQYNIAQSSNVMWLDGVYMLPLILLGVYKLVRYKKTLLLGLAVGFSIIFNWYSGGINCLFSIMWFVFEAAYWGVEQKDIAGKLIMKKIFFSGIRYIGVMITGVLLSACLFIPTIAAMQGGRASFDWNIIRNSFAGFILTVIQGNTLGAISNRGQVSLFCGSLAVIGCIGFFVQKKISIKKKAITGIMLGITVLLFYWQPFIAAFSLMKSVGSYWYRYSYVAIFLVLFIAAAFFGENCRQKRIALKVVVGAVVFSSVLFALHFVNEIYSFRRTYISAAMLLVITVAVACYLAGKSEIFRKVSAAVVAVLLLTELSVNTAMLMGNYNGNPERSSTYNVNESYATYVSAEENQIYKLQKRDPGVYRISQTSTRHQKKNGLRANYNEALAFNYWSILGYTSDPDPIQTEFLDRLGYRLNGNVMCIVNSPIIPADSLLNVKYLLADYPVNGLECIESLGEYNGKKVYYNPFCLPFAFAYPDNSFSSTDEMNPFEYQNWLYSQLTGEDSEIYLEASYLTEETQDGKIYHIEIPEGNYAVYGNLVWGNEGDVMLYVNNSYETGYAQWLSPSVFYIPTDEKDRTAVLQLRSEESVVIKDTQFYVADLDKLAEVSQKISENEAKILKVENGYFKCTINGNTDENIFISIPYDNGWEITQNGKRIEPELFANCMISLSLSEGENVIEMSYHVPGVALGRVLSVCGVSVLVLENLLARKKRKIRF